MKKILLICVFILSLPTYVFAASQSVFYETALVLEFKENVRPMNVNDSGSASNVQGMVSIQEVKLRILSGKFKGQERIVENSMFVNPVNLEIKKGDKVIVYLEESGDGDFSVQIHDYYRLPQLFWLLGIFLAVILIVGRGKGFRALISLLLAILLIFKVFIPLVLSGINPVWSALIISFLITVISILIIIGRDKKTVPVILGTTGGLFLAALLAITFGNLSRLTGLSSEEARILSGDFNLNFKGILFSGMIITALGAIMDVAVSIASGMAEIARVNPNIERKRLIKSGINLGRDIIGTMSNTLIFAYVGTSLFVLLLFTEYGESYLKFFNFDFVAEEIIGALAGSIGLILVIPFTAVISGYVETRK